ncbi:hypothetical protein KFL_001440070 [Klebsormidium nitens]|uniref:BTB domain-containing protein n=1 Tax=Klebsormidium nitens TaxID=105231 RepID=A0A1Y1I1K1_KLENI|nr:hypothetical protein KFL_001440070 [Klebsormidium nitens]|eukprot:GAQ83319.1 hypothetical protein KFL_001440070 [Klebsormidium nitens]
MRALGFQRRQFSRTEWNFFSCKAKVEPKVDLITTAGRTGDLILVGEEGVEEPAHSAVLIDIPYFEANSRDEWSGKVWNLHNKLRLELPSPAGREALGYFLKYVYGDRRSLYKFDPTGAQLLQELLSLGDACGVPALCADVTGLVIVTATNVDSWLAWLLKEHGVDIGPIRKQVVQVMKDKLQSGMCWEDLTVEQLSTLAALQNSFLRSS